MMHSNHWLIKVGILMIGSLAWPVLAVDEGTTIIGSEESPTVLNVVPWKTKELSVDPWKEEQGPSSTILNQVMKPLDRDELLREVEYYNLLHSEPEGAEQ